MRNNIEQIIRISSAAVLIAWIALSGLQVRRVWASASDSTDEETAGADEPAASNAVEAAAPLPTPAPPQQIPQQQAAHAGKLLGTAVVKGGVSYAVVQGANGLLLVREGMDIFHGARLLQVKRGLIVVESQGVQQEIRLGFGSESAARGEEANAPPQTLTNEVEDLLALRAQKLQALLRLRSHQLQ
jgi:hypothetical protein